MSDAQPTGTRFGRVPARWLDLPDIGTDELAVLTALAVHAGRDGVCCVRQNVLANKLKRSREWVNRIIARLVRLDGVLEKERRADRKGWMVACRYHLPDLVVCEPDTSDVTRGAHPEQTPKNKDSSSLSRAGRACEPKSRSINGEEGQGEATGTGTAPVLPPADWQPTAENIAWLAEHRPDLDAAYMTAVFVTGCRAQGRRYVDLSAAWRQWAIRERPPRPTSQQPKVVVNRTFSTHAAPIGRAIVDDEVADRITTRIKARRAD
jgi:hypothetical protein